MILVSVATWNSHVLEKLQPVGGTMVNIELVEAVWELQLVVCPSKTQPGYTARHSTEPGFKQLLSGTGLPPLGRWVCAAPA